MRELFGQRVAEAHHNAAIDLAFQRQRIDRAADVVRGDDLQHFHFARVGIHFHQRRVRRIRESHMHVAIAGHCYSGAGTGDHDLGWQGGDRK